MDSCVPSLWVSDLGEGGATLVNLVPFEGWTSGNTSVRLQTVLWRV